MSDCFLAQKKWLFPGPLRQEPDEIGELPAGQRGGQAGRHQGAGVLALGDLARSDDLRFAGRGIFDLDPVRALALDVAAEDGTRLGRQGGRR
ncbi:MAG: hypothetical protein R3F11_11965 [Verrucomicrobiales bacterium]